MQPAKTIIDKLGGATAVAKIVGVHRTRVSNWCRPKEKGGTGGHIPHWHMEKLLKAAKDQGVPLAPVDFLPAPSTEAA
jgi:hypothetical protein